MILILRHELQCEPMGCTVIIHLDPQTAEFSREFDGHNPLENKTFIELIQSYVRENFPNVKIKLVKIMIGSVVVATISYSGIVAGDYAVAASTYTQTSYTSYTVAVGDTLWMIANKFGTTVNDIKTANNLTADSIYSGQQLKIPKAPEPAQPIETVSTYKVASGDSLYLIAKKFNTTIAYIKTLNNMSNEIIYVGQVLKVPSVSSIPTPAPTPTPVPAPTPVPTTYTYTVVTGDTLWIVAGKFNTTVDHIKSMNNLATDMLVVGQVLKIPSASAPAPTPVPAPTPTPTPAPAPAPAPVPSVPTITYLTHKVVSGDNPWNLSIKYGIPMTELLKVNGFTLSTVLNLGQEVKIPVHNIPIKATPGPQYGERLDWWTEAQYVFPINKTAKITDFATGRVFYIKRTIGANHADCEPLTAADAATMKQVWGGEYSWVTRAVLVEVDGRKLAGSIASMPHDVEYIMDNDFTGHFDLHFLNSTRHKDGLIDPYHQTQINLAAGYVQK